MKYAIISDLHANAAALRHVLADIAAQGAERIVCLGDVVGYGPLPAETVAMVRKSVTTTLCGNHDAAVAGRLGMDDFIGLAGDAVKRHQAALKSEDLAWLGKLPYTCELEGAIAAHGDFTDPPGFGYMEDESVAARSFAATEARLMFVGHTHVPGLFLTGQSGAVYRLAPQDFVLEDGKRYIVNPGSVGYPREDNGTCRSSYVLYDATTGEVMFRFLPFSVSSVLQRGGMPRRPPMRLIVGAAVLVGVALGTAAYFVCRPSAANPPLVERAPVALADDRVVARKSIPLGPDSRQVRANVKIDRRGDPVDLRLEFLSASGDPIREQTDTVKMSSAKRFPVPKGAVEARFTLLRQTPSARPNIISFEPEFL